MSLPMRHFGKLTLMVPVLAMGMWIISGSPAQACGCGGCGGYGRGYGGYGFGGYGYGGYGWGRSGWGNGWGNGYGYGGYGWGGPGYGNGWGNSGWGAGWSNPSYAYGGANWGNPSYAYRGYGWTSPDYGGYGYVYPGSGLAGGYGYGNPNSAYQPAYQNSNIGIGNPGFAYNSGYVAPGTSASRMAPREPRLGINEELVLDGNNQPGIKVTNVQPGTPAAQAGLQAGDVIHSANGYFTQVLGNLEWIIENKTPNKVLTMDVRTARDGQAHTITAQLR